MQTGEIAKALGVHYNTAYNLAASKKVSVPKGTNGQYDWSEEHLKAAQEIMAARGSRTRRPARSTTPPRKPRGSTVRVTDKQDQKVLELLARLEGKEPSEYLRGLLEREASKVRQEVSSVLG